MADSNHKTCSRCGIAKPTTDYCADRRAKDGLQSACRACDNERRRLRRVEDYERIHARETQYWHEHRERILLNNKRSRERRADAVKAGKKAWYERVKETPEFRAKVKARQETNKAAKSAYDREYRKRNPEKNLERARRWQKANPQKRKAIVHNYTARRRTQEVGGVSTSELARWTAAQKKICYWCGTPCSKGFHVDHYIPLSKGGRHDLANLVIACGPCNLKKNAKDPLDFAREVGRLL